MLLRRAVAAIAVSAGLAPCAAYAQSASETTLPRRPEPVFAPRTVNVFADLTSSTQHDRRPTYQRDDDLTQFQAGGLVRVAPNVSLSLGAAYNDLRGDKRFPEVGKYKMTGYTAFAGATYYVAQNYSFNATAGLVRNKIRQDRIAGATRITEGHDLDGEFVSLSADANYLFATARAALFARYLYYHGVEPASVDSGGFARDRFTDTLGRITLGGEAYKRVQLGRVTVEPMARVALLYDTRLQNFYHDRSAFDVAAGFNVPFGATTIAFRVSSILGRKDYQNTDLRISLYRQF